MMAATRKTHSKLSQELKNAIREGIKAGTTLYAIAQGSGVDYAQLHRFMDRGDQHRDIHLEGAADRLAAYLGLELRPIRERGKTGSGRKGQVGSKAKG
jgi:hypothetical protein